MSLRDDRLDHLAVRLAHAPGVVGVMLGGSRARGDHAPDSDVDLGLYYRSSDGGPDTTALGALARAVGGSDARVTAPGEWGPWVDGGGWLTIDGTAVDWLYRDLDRVEACWAGARVGRYAFHAQAGHPLGVPDFAYPGEVALGRVLADPTGVLTALHEEYATYPPALADAVVAGLWEAGFTLEVARKGARRGDAAYVAACLARAVLLASHALHARAGRWLVNEKGAVAAAGLLPGAPEGFAARVRAAVGRLGEDLGAALDDAGHLVGDVRAAVTAG